MTNIEDIYNDPCQKLDAFCVDAYFNLGLDPEDQSNLTLDSSWGETTVDLTPAIQAGETITHLLLTDSALQYNREDYGRKDAENGGVDCIGGDALSRIISMKYLKDVDQTTAPTNGDIYMFNGATSMFSPYNLQSFITQTNNAISTLNGQVTALQNGLNNLNARVDGAIADYTNKINALQTQVTANANAISVLQTTVNNLQTAFNNYQTATNNRLSAIEAVIAKPSWAPSDAVIAWGNIDVEYNANPTGKGVYTHNPNSNVSGDMRFN